jgi:protein-disulfide isomerase
MASGKQSRRRRRAGHAAPPPVQAKGRRRQASRRVRVGAAALLILIVVGVALGLAFDRGASSTTSVPARGSLANGVPGASEVDRLLKGISQHGNVLGSPTAPATLIEYVDLQCPYCQQFETQAMPTLFKNYVRTGKVKIELRPIAFIGPDSQTGRFASIAAGKQNKQFNFVQLVYLDQGAENTGWLNSGRITAVAASIPGLDVPRLLEQQGSAATEQQAGSFDQQAKADRITATPTLLVGRSGQTARPVTLTSPVDTHSVAAAINRALVKNQ